MKEIINKFTNKKHKLKVSYLTDKEEKYISIMKSEEVLDFLEFYNDIVADVEKFEEGVNENAKGKFNIDTQHNQYTNLIVSGHYILKKIEELNKKKLIVSEVTNRAFNNSIPSNVKNEIWGLMGRMYTCGKRANESFNKLYATF